MLVLEEGAGNSKLVLDNSKLVLEEGALATVPFKKLSKNPYRQSLVREMSCVLMPGSLLTNTVFVYAPDQ